ncbi:hypothetical protein CLM85_12885 [Streptomyces albidoflavus]|nr:hypothetical protein CLM82_24020 [Streptomyces albidoflavus]PBO20362.1 hypothetical protein CLM83_01070 [Streptomyces albidoflavus]PBO24002.1 hypothetical protein CLM85_12885 [Streptomyces albidoflavus]PBO26511.1 hypothetical protein CLM84_31450 [Streptomyces albidoflavus]
MAPALKAGTVRRRRSAAGGRCGGARPRLRTRHPTPPRPGERPPPPPRQSGGGRPGTPPSGEPDGQAASARPGREPERLRG